MTSRFGFAGYSLVALVAIAALGCSPDRAIAPNDRPRPSGPAADIANLPTTAPILYAQPSPGFSMSGASGDDTTLFADDFEVPAGEVWTVKELVVSGQLLNNTQLLAISIRDNVGGVPGAPRPGANAALSPVKSDPPDGPSVGNQTASALYTINLGKVLVKPYKEQTKVAQDTDTVATANVAKPKLGFWARVKRWFGFGPKGRSGS